jgi:hypothetical protein
VTKRTFEIAWPDDLGPLWMNTSNLLVCLTQACPNTRFTVVDVTGDEAASAAPETAGPVNPARDNRAREAITAAVAQGWCTPRNAHKAMDVELGSDIVDLVFAATR